MALKEDPLVVLVSGTTIVQDHSSDTREIQSGVGGLRMVRARQNGHSKLTECTSFRVWQPHPLEFSTNYVLRTELAEDLGRICGPIR